MPFTLAHPAAVLPLKRLCPQTLSFPALVVGSMAPDTGYWFKPHDFGKTAHTFAGSFWFDLPAGLLLLAVIYLTRAPVEKRLPAAYRELSLALWPQRLGTPLAVIVSLLLGIWTHLLWDTFTHNHGWLVERVTALQTPIFHVRGRAFRVSHLVSYACSFVGVALLLAAAAKWREDSLKVTGQRFSQSERWKLLWIACLVLPITAIHHLVPSLGGLCLVAVLSLIMMISAARVLAASRNVTS